MSVDLMVPPCSPPVAAARDGAVARYLILDTPPETQFDDLMPFVARRFGALHAGLSLVTAERVWFKAATDGAGHDRRPQETFCAHVVAAGRPLVIADALADHRFVDHPRVGPAGDIRFYVGVPLVTADGIVIGALCAWDPGPRQPAADEVRALEKLAGHVVNLLEQRRTRLERERESVVLHGTGEVLKQIVGGGDLPGVLHTLARAVEASRPGMLAAIQLLDGSTLHNGASPSLPRPFVAAIEGVEIGPLAGSCGTAAFTGQPVIVSDIARDPRWADYREVALAHGLRSCWSVPVTGPTGTVLGTFALYRQQVGSPTADDLEQLTRWVNLAELAITRVRDLGAMRAAATTDPLTGLANRAEARRRLADALRQGHPPLTVLFVDLDRFKFVNDSLGHRLGDQFLRQAAARVAAAVRGTDSVARLGGDEFLVQCPGLGDRDTAEAMARRVLGALHRPMTVEGHTLSLSASIGIARAAAGTDVLASDLIGDADLAMYTAKRAGRNSVAMFDILMRERAAQRLTLESELNLALLAGDLDCYYQPSVDLATGAMVGVEALIRWPSVTRGMVDPAVFIPVAEDSGLIVEIGDFVLHRACRQLAQWRAGGVAWEAVTMWVNVSVRQLADGEFLASVDRILAATGVPPERLGLEVTESCFMADVPLARQTLQTLRERGIKVAIDDFGTGYSSLALLQDLPVDVLKIDRQFIADMAAMADTHIVGIILDLAARLDLQVVAEGIETSAQRDQLQGLGCEFGQGYLWSRPLPAAELAAHVASEPGSPGRLQLRH